MTLILVLLLVAGLAAYLVRPPAFIPWPGYRWSGLDVARLRVSVARLIRDQATEALEAERATSRKLREEITRLRGRVREVTHERNEARTQRDAARALAYPTALEIVAAGGEGEGDDAPGGAAGFALTPPRPMR